MIRVPTDVYDRLLRLSADIDRQRLRNGRAYTNVPQTEQGERGAWTPIHAIITRALDEFEAHRARGNRKRARLPRRTRSELTRLAQLLTQETESYQDF
jgi:hypothetical protein